MHVHLNLVSAVGAVGSLSLNWTSPEHEVQEFASLALAV